ncbi:MAG TPA: TonB family protein [Caulobacteraceae bacterium]|jgi:TonB family protein
MSAAIPTLVLAGLLRANLAGSAAIFLILALRRPVRLRFGPTAAYLLWLAAPLCILAGLLPPPASASVLAPAVTLAAAAAQGLEPVARRAGLGDLLIAIWAAGAVVMAALFARRQARFVRSLGRLRPLEGSPGVLRGEHLGAGPFILGSLRPKIVTPADFDVRFAGEARGLVLAHERVHLDRGDATVNGLLAAAQCLAWFNPLVHLAARLLRVDQEIACDAAVIARRPEARRLYAETLLDAALMPRMVPFGCHWPAAGAHSLKERLTMLQLASVSPLRRKLGSVLVAVMVTAGAGAVWAANPARLVGKPDWVERPTAKDLVAFYPKAAEKAHVHGMVVLDCRVRPDGGLRACKVRSQDPPKYGFGEAALKMSASFRMKAKDGDGRPTAGAGVRIPIKFALAG